MKRQRLVAGLRLNYLEAGEGETLLLLHGTAIDSAQLSYGGCLEHLAQNYHVIAPDWPGYGESEYPVKSLELDDYTDLLSTFIHDLALDKLHLVGFSMGGAIALNYALNVSSVRSLTLVSSYGLSGRVHVPLLPYLMLRVPRLARSLWSGLRFSKPLLSLVLRYAIFAKPDRVSPELIDEVYAQLKKPMVERAFMNWIRGQIGILGLKSHYQRELHRLKVPTLLLHGARDLVIPAAYARRAASYLPHAQLSIVPDCGHWLLREKRDHFLKDLEAFLATLTAQLEEKPEGG
ncbi:MAG: alpha/beta hydrolase [Trueperaceae bacterium]|nr:alpha/beta hydrolase [Trueperaceae bacterium]